MRKFLILLVFVGVGLFWLLRPASKSEAPVEPVAVQQEAAPEAEVLENGLPQPRRRRPANGKATGFDRVLVEIDQMLQNGDVQGAVEKLEGLLAQDPTNERALEELGMIYLTELQDPTRASDYFKKSLSINADNEFALMELVGISTHPDRAQSTIGYLRDLQAKNPESAVLADGLGELLMSQGRLKEAIPQLEKSASDPRYAEFAYARLASVHQQRGDTPKAIEAYRRQILHQSQEIEKRRSEGGNTEMVETDRARSLLEMADLLMREGRLEEAADKIDQARSRLGDDWEVGSKEAELRRLQEGT